MGDRWRGQERGEALCLTPSSPSPPQVDTAGLALVNGAAVPAGSTRVLAPASARTTYTNLPLTSMHAPVLGPARPGASSAVSLPASVLARGGVVEDAAVSDFAFDDAYATFGARGYAAAPGGGGRVVGDVVAWAAAGGGTLAEGDGGGGAPKQPRKKAKKARDAEPPADPDASWTLTRRAPWADKTVAPARPTEEQRAWLKTEGFIQEEEEEEEGGAAAVAGPTTAATTTTAQSTFHGAAETDAVGRSWIEPPRGVRASDAACFPPKRCVHTWQVGAKAVSRVAFFPRTGHLLLTGCLDGAAKVWDTAGEGKRLLRSYRADGAGKKAGGDGGGRAASKKQLAAGVRDAAFDGTGARFATASYSKRVTLWDTETGAALASLGDGSTMHYCLTWHPSPDAPHVLLGGGADRKITQWDVRSGDVVQEYNYHLGPVNSVTFFDGGRSFASTSDDKSIRIWEYGIPVQTRVIADPGMHAITAAASHPTAAFIAMQSADNRILTYSTQDRFKAVPKKTFTGHAVAGYACRPTFSHDGRYLVSGDGDGKAFFWDWKNARVARSFKAHDGVCADVAWHPLETSKVATAGWDGVVKYWD